MVGWSLALTYGGDESGVEGVLGEPEKDAGLAHPGVSDEEQLEQVVVRLGHLRQSGVSTVLSHNFRRETPPWQEDQGGEGNKLLSLSLSPSLRPPPQDPTQVEPAPDDDAPYLVPTTSASLSSRAFCRNNFLAKKK